MVSLLETINQTLMANGANSPYKLPTKNDLSGNLPESAIEVPVVKSKGEMAVEWLNNHREDLELSGLQLEKKARPYGTKISRTYWNDAKKQVLEQPGAPGRR